MKRIIYSAAMLFALLTTACGSGNKEVSELPQIDVNTNYPEKEICLQDVAEVSYVALDSQDDLLFNGSVGSLSDKGIVIYDGSNQRLLFFDKQGKFLNSVDRKGQGPEEYSMMFKALVDWDKDEVLVLNSYSQSVVYSLDGTFKRRLTFESDVNPSDVYYWSDGQCVSYRKAYLDEDGQLEPYQPIVFYSRETGKMEDSLSYRKEHEFPLIIGNGSMKMEISYPSLVKLNGDVYVNDLSADTIYRLVHPTKALQPVITRTPSVLDDKEGYFMDLYGITPQFYFFKFSSRQLSFDAGNFRIIDEMSKNAIYDRKDGKVYHPKFSNKDYPSMEKFDLRFSEEVDACATIEFEAFDLIEALEAGELSGELKTVAEGLKEDDNPVLMVVKFKE
jgi:hypothetical protein